MPVSESKKKANAKWDSENMATVACKIKKSQAEKFKSYCSSIGKTSNAVIRDYVLECIDEKEPATGDQSHRIAKASTFAGAGFVRFAG